MKPKTPRQLRKIHNDWLATRMPGKPDPRQYVEPERSLIDLTRLRFHQACAELRATFRPGLYRYLFPDGWEVPPRDPNEEGLMSRVLRG